MIIDDYRMLKIDEAAHVLRTPVATLRWWRHLGAGPRSFKVGRRIFYRTGDLLAWLDEQYQQATDREVG